MNDLHVAFVGAPVLELEDLVCWKRVLIVVVAPKVGLDLRAVHYKGIAHSHGVHEAFPQVFQSVSGRLVA